MCSTCPKPETLFTYLYVNSTRKHKVIPHWSQHKSHSTSLMCIPVHIVDDSSVNITVFQNGLSLKSKFNNLVWIYSGICTPIWKKTPMLIKHVFIESKIQYFLYNLTFNTFLWWLNCIFQHHLLLIKFSVSHHVQK